MGQNQKISPLKVMESRNFNGLTETNHLVNAYLVEPEKVGSIMSYAFGYQENNVLSLLTGGLGNTQTINAKEFEWDLHTENERAIDIVQDSPDGGAQPGYGGMPFRIFLAEKWFDATDNLVADDGTQVRVVEEPTQEGNAFVYRVVLTDPNKPFIAAKNVQKGAKFSKDYSTVEEYSTKGGGHGHSTPFRLRNQLTTLRKTYKVSRNAAKAVMIIELPDPENPGKTTKLWTKKAEWDAMANWYRELDRSFMYSIYNKNQLGVVDLKGETGRPVYHGAGLRQQISPSNRQYYTRLSYDILDGFLLDLSYSANKWGGDHHFVALTGKMGMREFDRAVKEYANSAGITVTDSGTFINGSGDSLELTGYFKTVKFLNGISVSVKEFPQYDDITRNRTLHPVTKKPVESYRFTFLNVSGPNGKSNIEKMALKDSEQVMWHVAGSTDPFGGVAHSVGTMRATGIDGYDVHMLSECGIKLGDPTSCGELILRVED